MQSQLYPCMCLRPSVLAGPFPRSRNQLQAGQDKPLALDLPQDRSQPSLPARADCAPQGLAQGKPTEEHPPALLLAGRPQERGVWSAPASVPLHRGDGLQNSPTAFLTGQSHPPLPQLLLLMSQPRASSLRGQPEPQHRPSLPTTAGPGSCRAEGLPGARPGPVQGSCILPRAPTAQYRQY